MKRRRGVRVSRRWLRAASLAFFLFLLWATAWPLPDLGVPQDLYLRLDPLAALLAPLTARDWGDNLLPGLLVIAATVFFGRIFCGYICPMGITLDMARRAGAFFQTRPGTAARTPLSPHWRKVKYWLLAVMAVTAFLGVNTYFWGSPIALVTRLYALVVHPLVLLLGEISLRLGRPLFSAVDASGLGYASLEPRRFTTVYFVLFFFAALFLLERLRPRFWCRYLCPAGALLALASFRPVWRRKVSKCTGCDGCVRVCPTGAIAPGGLSCAHAECITCLSCTAVCPVAGVAFRTGRVATGRKGGAGEGALDTVPSRRAFLGALGTGVVLAGVQSSGAQRFFAPGNLGNPWNTGVVRPPGSLPEPAFLDRCLRCGQCMKACPTNGLQPVWFASGVEGMFSPALFPRCGPCEPECNACGRVCPTGAIAALPLREKQWAKIGTAVVLQYRCLAWAEGRRCMVCQEVCPFGAVRIVRREGQAVPVPVVDAARCYGCGYCERHCPVNVPAIRVEPLNALRRDDGNYREAALTMGLILEPGAHNMLEDGGGDLPPGFTP